MTLADTVTAMTSEDWRDRLWAEYWQLEIRINDLEHLVADSKTGAALEVEQLDAMRRYLHALAIRCEKARVGV